MSKIEFNINAQNIQGEHSKVVRREQLAAFFDLQPTMPEGVKKLDAMTENAFRIILSQYDGSSFLVTGDYALFPDDMKSSLNDIFAKLKLSGMLVSYSLNMNEWSVMLTPDGLSYFIMDQKALGREAAAFGKLPSNTYQLLQEIVGSDDPAGMLRKRFDNCTYNEDQELRGMLRELVSEGYIRVPVWANEVPLYLEVDDSAREYQGRKADDQIFQTRIAGLPPMLIPAENPSLKQYDVFISQAGKGRLVYTDELFSSLSGLGVRILYDKDALPSGENLKRKIHEGVDKSEFTILVLSESCLDGDWTEKELNQLLRRHNQSGQKIVLPLLYNITANDLQKTFPSLHGHPYMSAAGKSCEEISICFAKELIARLKQMIL